MSDENAITDQNKDGLKLHKEAKPPWGRKSAVVKVEY